MKTTVELSDTLLTELKVIAAREHRRLRDVMEEVVALGLRSRRQAPAGEAVEARAEAWLRDWQALGRRIEAQSKDPRSCVDILLSERR
jgi:plasmid stability protein